MVEKDPQNPIAIKIEYFGSRLKCMDTTTNIPSMKLPTTLIIRILIGNAPKCTGDSAILYLKNAPTSAPNPNNRNSIPFIFAHHFLFIGRHYQHSEKRFWYFSKANAIAQLCLRQAILIIY